MLISPSCKWSSGFEILCVFFCNRKCWEEHSKYPTITRLTWNECSFIQIQNLPLLLSFVTRHPFCLRKFEKFCLCTASLVLSTRLAVPKQSFSNLLRQNGHRVTKVYWVCKCTKVICRGRTPKWITTPDSINLQMIWKPNSIIVLLFIQINS